MLAACRSSPPRRRPRRRPQGGRRVGRVGFAQERGGAVPTPTAAQEVTNLALDEPELEYKPDGSNSLEIVVTTPLANTALSMGWNGEPLTEGPFFDGQSQRPLLDHVYTYFDNGLAQAVLTPYVDSVVTE